MDAGSCSPAVLCGQKDLGFISGLSYFMTMWKNPLPQDLAPAPKVKAGDDGSGSPTHMAGDGLGVAGTDWNKMGKSSG